ncbi:MAG: metal-dependent hydrolase [Thiohalorhabdus sp.]|uniref:metal-dependent hydrolase n=1 Tax=Thiohalorhabdus sp. TaxID=3094134 RepID=UPI00397FFBEB
MRTILTATVLLLSLALAPAAGAADATKVTWLGHAAFKVETPAGGVALIDPWLTNPKNDEGEKLLADPGAVDVILLTHAHPDHVGEAVELGKETGARLVAPFELGQQLVAQGYPEDQVGMDSLMNIGGEVELLDGELEVLMTPAVHSSGLERSGEDAPSHHYGASPVGYRIKVAGGPAIYHAGDTDVFGDMELIRELAPVDVMLAPIGGHFTMDPERAAYAINRLVQPEAVIPMHYGTFEVLEGRPDALAEHLDEGVEMRDLEVNETAEF